MDKVSGIYIIRNKINNKIYIGQSINIHNRIKSHKYRGSLFYKAIKKYGWDNFYYEILEECSNDFLDEKEIFYIKKYKSIDKDIGYNILTEPKENPVPKGSKRTQELKDKWSLNRKGKRKGIENSFYGKKHSDDAKKIMSDRKKISYIGKGNPFFGKKHSIETISKLKEIGQKRDMSRFFKKVIQIDLITNQIIKEWNSAADAAEFLLGSRRKAGGITQTCKGKYKSSNGYLWKYK